MTVLTKDQKISVQKCRRGDGPWMPRSEFVRRYKTGACEYITATLRYDDECGNGHNTFSITGSTRGRGGCIHDEIEAAFPEFAHLIKWHLCSSDGPMHYISNTLWHADDRDCWGLRKGEIQYSKKTTTYVYDCEPESDWQEKYRREDGGLPLRMAAKRQDGAPTNHLHIEEHPEIVRVGEGSERDLDAARRAAIWPDATDEQLCSERSVLKAMLMERLPALLDEFQHDMEAIGFTF